MYLAIDIETTGLDPEKHQVLEIGAVMYQPGKAIMECPTFRALIEHDEYRGSAVALAMNHRLLQEIADVGGGTPGSASNKFRLWLFRHLPKDAKVHLLGKNVGSFDLQFLKRLPYWPVHQIHYRCLDVGSLWATPEGMKSQAELEAILAEDYNIPGEPHEALYDARVSLALAIFKWEHEE